MRDRRHNLGGNLGVGLALADQPLHFKSVA